MCIKQGYLLVINCISVFSSIFIRNTNVLVKYLLQDQIFGFLSSLHFPPRGLQSKMCFQVVRRSCPHPPLICMQRGLKSLATPCSTILYGCFLKRVTYFRLHKTGVEENQNLHDCFPPRQGFHQRFSFPRKVGDGFQKKKVIGKPQFSLIKT